MQVGTQTGLERTPVELAEQGIVFTDFHSALEEIPKKSKFFMSSVKYDDSDKLAAYHTAYFSSGAVPTIRILRLQRPIERFSTKTVIAMAPFNKKHILIIAGKNSKLVILNV